MKKAGWIGLLGVLLSAGFLLLAFRGVDLQLLWQTLAQAQWGWALPAVAIYFLGHWFRGWRSCIILRRHTQIGQLRAMNLILIGYAANNILPARLGEFLRGFLLGRLQGLSMALSLSTVFVERIFDGMAIVAILFSVSLLTPLPSHAEWLAWAGGSVFLGAFSFVLGLAFLQERFLRLLQWMLKPFPAVLAEKVLGLARKLLEGLGFLRSMRDLIPIFILSSLVWLSEGAMFALTLKVFDLNVPAVAAWFATSVTNLGIALPSSPGYIGTFHEFCKESIKVFGVEDSAALAYAVVVHALHFIPVTLTGLLALHHYGFRLGGVVKELEQPEKQEKGSSNEVQGAHEES